MKNIAKYLKSHSKTLYWVLFSLILAVLVIIQYYGVVHFHYPDTPGDDTLNHWGTIQSIKANGNSLWQVIRSGGYPPLYHFSILKISALFNLPEMTVMLWTYPAIIVFASLAVYFLAYSIFKNKWIALLALVLYAFSSRTPIQLLHDGGYPNLIAAHILLPSAVAFLILAWKAPKSVIARKNDEAIYLRDPSSKVGMTSKNIVAISSVITNTSRVSSRASLRVEGSLKYKQIVFYILGGLFAILVLLTHHISTFEMLGVAITATPILLVAAWIKNKWKWWKGIILLTVYCLLLTVLGYLYFNSPIFAPFRGLASIMIVVTNKFPFIKSLIKPEDAAIVPWKMLPGRIGRLVVPLALVFIPLFSFFKSLRERKIFYPLVLISVWSLMLLVLSQSTLFTNPERLARDSALPLSVLAAGSIYYIGQYLSKKKILLGAFIAICIFLAYSPVKDRFCNALHYEPMVRVTQVDLQAIDILKANEPAPVLVNGWSQFIDKHLAGWQVTHTDFQSPAYRALVKNPVGWDSKAALSAYKYIYIIDSQLGWAPGTEFGYAKNFLNQEDFRLLGEFTGPTNHIYLFENRLFGN